MGAGPDSDSDHRARLLEASIHRVLEERERQGTQLFVKSPTGWVLGGRGRGALAFLIVIAALAGIYYHDRRSEEDGRTRAIEHQHMYEAMRETTYVLTLTEDQRRALNLQMPDSLRGRLGFVAGTPRP